MRILESELELTFPEATTDQISNGFAKTATRITDLVRPDLARTTLDYLVPNQPPEGFIAIQSPES